VTPYYADPWLTVYAGDCRAVMAELPGASVHTVVTSPPYWGLRDYGTATWTGGDEACDHVAGRGGHLRDSAASTRGGANKVETAQAIPYRDVCGKCGATRVDGQIGLESTPEAYVETMVAVFREVRRVLRDDGTVWLNLGDTYASGERATGRNDTDRETPGGRGGSFRGGVRRVTDQRDGLKPKDLVGIPWRVAFALQADGWYLRSDVVWSKPNPMPESVTDRPTKSHEYVFLLSKRERYYFDADAVRLPVSPNWQRGAGPPVPEHGYHVLTEGRTGHQARRVYDEPKGANIRSVWTIATQPYPGAHFATFPEALVKPCVKAGTSERGVCPDCGAPWVRQTRREGGERYATGKSAEKNGAGLVTAFSGYMDGSSAPTFITTGWRPSCHHDVEPVPATVLDPFAGSGTTGRVAQRLGRRAVLIDLNPAYLLQALKRNGHGPDEVGTEPMFDQSPLWGGEAA
jgi:DNA modification methylase